VGGNYGSCHLFVVAASHKIVMASFRPRSSACTRSSAKNNSFLSDFKQESSAYRDTFSDSDSGSETEGFSDTSFQSPSIRQGGQAFPSFSSPGRNRKSGNESLIKQVPSDIEAARKLDPKVKPSEVFSLKPDIFGEPKSALRRKV
jgi:hypothetical protein